MMVLVTVGTTKFNSLIREMERIAANYTTFSFVFQVAKGGYRPLLGEVFEFRDNIGELLAEADLVVTHAGAGSIYSLLELKKRILVVPNTERKDKHQLDIAEYVRRNNFATVALSVNELEIYFAAALTAKLNPYVKDEFFYTTRLVDQIFDQ